MSARVVTTGRRGGRPRVADADTVPVSVRVPVPVHDVFVRTALSRGVSVAQVYREVAQREASAGGFVLKTSPARSGPGY